MVGSDLNPHPSHPKDALFFLSLHRTSGVEGALVTLFLFMAPRITGSRGATHPSLPPMGNCSFVCGSDPLCPCSYVTCLLRGLAF